MAGAIPRKQYEYIPNVLFTLVAALWTTSLGDKGEEGEAEEESKKRFPKHEFFEVRLADAPNGDALLAKSTCDDAIWICQAARAPGMQMSASRSSTRTRVRRCEKMVSTLLNSGERQSIQSERNQLESDQGTCEYGLYKRKVHGESRLRKNMLAQTTCLG